MTSNTAPSPVPRKGGCKQGCGVVALAAAALVVWSVWRMGEPARRAAAVRAAMHRGMRVRDVIAASGEWFIANGGECVRPLAFYSAIATGDGGVTVDLRREKTPTGTTPNYDSEVIKVATRADLVSLVDKHPEVATCRTLGFTYLVLGVMPRSSLGVHFGPDGRVERINGPSSWD